MSALPFQSGVIFRTFAPDSGFGTYHAMLTAMVTVLNETHTNIYTGPRLTIML